MHTALSLSVHFAQLKREDDGLFVITMRRDIKMKQTSSQRPEIHVARFLLTLFTFD